MLALAACGLARFWNLKNTVLDGFDVFAYLNLAADWAQGKIIIAETYAKPGYVLLGALAVKLWGKADYTLPYLNAVLGLVNVSLVYAVGRQAGLSAWGAVGAMLAIGLLPAMVIEGRYGLPHNAALTFLLVSLWLLLSLRRRLLQASPVKPVLLSVLLGTATAYSGVIHPTMLALLALVPFLLAAVWLVEGGPAAPGSWRRLAMCQAGFSLGYAAVPLLFLVMDQGGGSVQARLESLLNMVTGHMEVQGPVRTWQTALGDAAHGLTATLAGDLLLPTTTLVLGAVFLAFGWRAWRGRREKPWNTLRQAQDGLLLLTLAAGLCLSIAIMTRGWEGYYFGGRLYLPAGAALILAGAVLGEQALRGSRWAPQSGPLICGAALALTLVNAALFFPYSFLTEKPFYHRLRDLWGTQLELPAGQNILLLPSAGMSLEGGLGFYWPDHQERILSLRKNRGWIAQPSAGWLRDLMRSGQVRFVILNGAAYEVDPKYLDYSDRDRAEADRRSRVQLDREFQAAQEALVGLGARLVYRTDPERRVQADTASVGSLYWQFPYAYHQHFRQRRGRGIFFELYEIPPP